LSRRPGPSPGRFRIIGGEWRSRRLAVPTGAEVRPTPDRVRETLFNWLAPVIDGARCLDLYAGSGALGLEALSRGAAEAVFVDRAPEVLRGISASLDLLRCERGRTACMEAMRFLDGPARPFDIVFVDPPYRLGLPGLVMEKLVAQGWLAPGARVYLEHEAEAPPPALPSRWGYFRSAAAGQVRYHLAIEQAGTAGDS
jgi:16S rRNA (guanine966-N2)-methyltransferase